MRLKKTFEGDKEMDRREFLKKSGQAALVASVGFESVVACAPPLKETKQDVAQIKWDCNPILPIPKEGCYTGTNMQSFQGATATFQEVYGVTPTFNAWGIGTWATFNEYLVPDRCQELIDRGTIPVTRYVTQPHTGYKPIIEGKFDDKFKSFANQAAEFGHPIVLLPWQGANEPDQIVWHWSGPPPGQYVEAWIRMHKIFQSEGANKNVIWSTKLICGRWPGHPMLDPLPYIPPSAYVDIVGWCCSSNLKSAVKAGEDLSFDRQFQSDYSNAASRYPTKPQMFWELGASGPGQAPWMDNALERIRTRYPRVKGVMFDVMATPRYGYDPVHTPETIQVIRKHFTSGYFKGSAIKK
jgi:hypothetical protein